MISVSTLTGPCPRCLGRRVYRVSVPTDEWSCVPNMIPFPWLREHIKDHDATETTQVIQVNDMNTTPTSTKTQHPRGAGHGG